MKKIVLVTGTSTGFGKLITQTLSKEGHTVIAAMRGVNDKNQAVARELAALPGVDVVELDVTSDTSVQEAFAKSLAKYGHINVLVNNAGLAGFGVTEAYTLDQVRRLFEVNFYGVLRTYNAVLPSMRARKDGLIINLSTGASGFTLPFMVPYMASKFAMEALTEGFQHELKDYGIENVSIQSGVYPTEMNTGVKPGVNADKEDIIAAYGSVAVDTFNAMGTALFGKMAEFKMDPQTIADGVLELINKEKGTRPLRFPLDAVAQGTDHEFVKSRAEIKDRWANKYGFNL
ncbi:SDR family oxidoreductase [Mucilaginibacter sp. SG564]|uniref:SDR family oxidoreductase n=1 Tax=Mucilaginibacter sp. SG564 TaxID=2587022 RepID=UPI00155450A5|nr:SDR family oxidoreductase [Mucilaginibacter sp. SG564]NOW93723.1 NAD(P)-dependent dehydrogenase (short-subunit alcohol dehydrogenase family) [Mucilaginibacter sp. SG564]